MDLLDLRAMTWHQAPGTRLQGRPWVEDAGPFQHRAHQLDLPEAASSGVQGGMGLFLKREMISILYSSHCSFGFVLL